MFKVLAIDTIYIIHIAICQRLASPTWAPSEFHGAPASEMHGWSGSQVFDLCSLGRQFVISGWLLNGLTINGNAVITGM